MYSKRTEILRVRVTPRTYLASLRRGSELTFVTTAAAAGLRARLLTDVRTSRSGSIEDDHVSQRLAAFHAGDGLVDLFDGVTVGDQLVELEPTLFVVVHQLRHVDPQSSRTHLAAEHS